MHFPLMGFRKATGKVLIRPVSLCDLLIVPNIIPRILERGIEARIQPDCVATKFLYIVQFCGDSVDITDTIRICIKETLWI
jgi:hypothetical protein